MKVLETACGEVKLIEPRVFADERGFFVETWNAQTFADLGILESFVQDNHSSSRKGVLRGIHYQLGRPQGKLVRVVRGRVFDVAVDLRASSPTFGKWFGAELSAENQRLLWVPPGFGHGFVALEDGTDFLYKCTDYYSPQDERTITWSDAALAIDWPSTGTAPLVSDKDRAGVSFAEAEVYP